MPRLAALAAAGRYKLDNPPPTAREVILFSLGIGFEHQYLFEGGAATYDDDEEGVVDLTVGGSAVHGGDQLFKESVDSIELSDAGANYLDYGAVALPSTTYIMEVWFRQPNAGHGKVVLIGQNGNIDLIVGRFDLTFNYPTCQLLVGGGGPTTYWESEVSVYGDNLPHQLIEFHEVGDRNNYIVCIDGMPVASGTNGGYLVNLGKPSFNGLASETANIRSGADFGAAYFMDNGGEMDLLQARLFYEAAALSGQDMLTIPRWYILDSVNVQSVGGTDDKDVLLGDVNNDTGIRSGAIPRNGKVYFEVFIINQGQATTAIRYGIRKLAEGGNVGNTADNAEDGYTQNSQFLADGLQATLSGQDNLALETAVTGNTFQIAIDWDTGDWWFGDGTNYKGSGTPGSADPANGTDPFGVSSGVGPLDVNVNWAVWVRNNGTLGNGNIRLVTAAADFAHTPPTGFVAWEDAI